MHLRPYRTLDFESLYAMDQRCFEPRFRFSRAVMREVVENAQTSVVLACEEREGREKVQGFCAASLQASEAGPAGYVATLDVEPESRGQGVGLTLLRWAELRCGEQGAMAMLLHVWPGNEAALRLYARAGYHRVSIHPGFYGRGFPAELWAKALPGAGTGATVAS